MVGRRFLLSSCVFAFACGFFQLQSFVVGAESALEFADQVAVIGREVAQHWAVATPPPTEAINSIQQQTFSAPQSDFIQVHFAQFNLRPGDQVQVLDGQGQLIDTYTGLGRGNVGLLGGFLTPRIAGPNATISYIPSSSIESSTSFQLMDAIDFGFTVDKIVRSATFMEERTICGTNEAEAPVCFTDNSTFVQVPYRSRAVAHIIAGSSACSGFLVGSEDYLLTAAHCVPNATVAASMEVRFNFQSSQCDTACQSGRDYLACFPNATKINPTLVAVNSTLDYALIKLNTEHSLAAQYGFMQLRASGPLDQESAYLPQHFRGLAKVVSASNDDGDFVRVTDLRPLTKYPHLISYDADTDGGSSGAPVIGKRDNTVIALHVSGGPGNYTCMNLGIDSRWIIADLYKKNALLSGLIG